MGEFFDRLPPLKGEGDRRSRWRGSARTSLYHARNRKRTIERRVRVNPTVERTDHPNHPKEKGRKTQTPFAPMGGCFVVPTKRVEPHLKLQLPGRSGALKPHPRPGVALACTIYVPEARGRRMLAVLRPASKLYVANNFGA